MGAHSSIKLTRDYARRLLIEHIAGADDNALRHMVSTFLAERTLYNCYEIVNRGEESDDARAENALSAAEQSKETK